MKRKSQKNGGVIGGGRSILIGWIPAFILIVGFGGRILGGVIGGS